MHAVRSLSLPVSTLVIAALAVSGCVSVPRGPALSLANAGISTTASFGSDIRRTAADLQYVDVTEAFVATYDFCQNPRLTCAPQVQSGQNFQERQALAKVVLARAVAIDALGKAYAALKTEAEYDARGDLVGATNEAIAGVNGFASAVAAIAGGAPGAALIVEPLSQVTAMGVGLLADRNQRKRLVAGSREIAQPTQRLRDALAVEAYVFDGLTAYLAKTRAAARVSLLDSGIASSSDAVSPLVGNLGLKPVTGVDGVVAKSLPARQAMFASLQAQSRAEVLAVQNRYQASLGALDALLRAHSELETGQSVSLADLSRFLIELDATLDASKED